MMEWRTSESRLEHLRVRWRIPGMHRFPVDAAGDVCVKMVRLEVEALKP